MLDLETLSTRSNAAILSIGAAMVQNPTDGFYVKCLPYEYSSDIFHRSEETLAWWHKQPAHIREEAFSGTVSLDVALKRFCEWFPADATIWSNGADFDIPIIKHALNKFEMKHPWHYRNIGCYRTFKNLMQKEWEIPADAPEHVAVWDAKWQAKNLHEMLTEWETLQVSVSIGRGE